MRKNLGIGLMAFPFVAFWTFILVSGGWQIALGLLAFAVGGAFFVAGYQLWINEP